MKAERQGDKKTGKNVEKKGRGHKGMKGRKQEYKDTRRQEENWKRRS